MAPGSKPLPKPAHKYCEGCFLSEKLEVRVAGLRNGAESGRGRSASVGPGGGVAENLFFKRCNREFRNLDKVLT
jgi:hypothetical protein